MMFGLSSQTEAKGLGLRSRWKMKVTEVMSVNRITQGLVR